MADGTIEEVLRFWFEEIDHARWFAEDSDFDLQIERRFGERLLLAKRGELDGQDETAGGRLALIVILDQFSRNIHRGRPAAFEADAKVARSLPGRDRPRPRPRASERVMGGLST